MRKYGLSASSAALIVAMAAGGVHAQTAAPVAQIQEIVVTAEKRESTSQRVPASLEVVTSQALARQQIVQLQDLNAVLPNVHLVPFVNSVQISVRGITSNFVDPRADPAVAASVNGLFYDRPLPFGFAFLDVARVEDLNGPQGTLYGRNAAGGALNIITNQPSQKFGGMAEATFGNYGENDFTGVVNLPLGDTLAVRAAYARDRRDGYIGNYYDDVNSDTGRVSVKWRPNDKLTVYGEADFFHQGGHGGIQEYYPCGGAQPWSLAIPAGCASLLRGAAGTISTNGTTGTHVESSQIHVDYDLGWATASSISGFVGTHERFNKLPNGVLLNSSVIDSLDYTEEFKLAGHDSASHQGGLAWQVGAFYFDSTGDFSQATATPIGTSSTFFTNLPQSSEAGFGQASYGVTDRLRITGGIRYTHDFKGLAGYGLFNTTAVSKTPKIGVDGDKVTYKGGVEYDLAPKHMLYANIATGYVAGGPDGGDPTKPTPSNISPVFFVPETITAYEVGSKNRFLNNRLQINGDFYYYDTQHLQFSTSSYLNNAPAVAPNFVLVVENIGSLTTYGVELDATFALTPADRFNASLTWAHGTYGGATYAGRSPTFQPAALPIPQGTALINQPDWSGLLGYDHTWTFGGGNTLDFSVNSKISAKYPLVIASTNALDTQKAYTTTDLSLSYGFQDNRYSIRGWVKNIENTPVNVYGQAPGQFVYGILPPRTYGATLTAHF